VQLYSNIAVAVTNLRSFIKEIVRGGAMHLVVYKTAKGFGIAGCGTPT
jgi:hypothetical protein